MRQIWRRRRRRRRDEFVGQVVCEYAWRAIAVPGRAAAEDLGSQGLSETAGTPALAAAAAAATGKGFEGGPPGAGAAAHGAAAASADAAAAGPASAAEASAAAAAAAAAAPTLTAASAAASRRSHAVRGGTRRSASAGAAQASGSRLETAARTHAAAANPPPPPPSPDELAHDMDLRTHAFAHASLRRERKRAPESARACGDTCALLMPPHSALRRCMLTLCRRCQWSGDTEQDAGSTCARRLANEISGSWRTFRLSPLTCQQAMWRPYFCRQVTTVA